MSASDVDRYLNEVSWAMGGTFSEQQAVRDELRANILAEAREHELSGLPPADALTRALVELGDATVVGKSLRSSRGTSPLRRPLVQPPGALSLAPRHVAHVPQLRLTLALAAATIASVAVALIYVWP